MAGEIRDIRMMSKALTQRWPIKPEYREAVITKLMMVIASKDSSAREITAAARGILAAEKQNQEDEHKLIDVKLQHPDSRISEIAAELGIDPALIVDATAKANRDIAGDSREQAYSDQ